MAFVQKFETYKNEKGEIGILYSPGYGAGWSTWGTDEMAYDKRVIDIFLKYAINSSGRLTLIGVTGSDVARFSEEVRKLYPDEYLGGAKNLVLGFVPPNVPFEIDEYDGSESLCIINTENFMRLN